MRRLFLEFATKLPAAASLSLPKHNTTAHHHLAFPLALTHHYPATSSLLAKPTASSARQFGISSWLTQAQSGSSSSGHSGSSGRRRDSGGRRPSTDSKGASIGKGKIKMSSNSNSFSSSGERKTRSSRGNKEARSSSNSNSVKHDKSHHRFTLELDDKQLARIDYRQREDGKNGKILELYHSEVPADLRGKGIGKALARGTFEHLAGKLDGDKGVKIRLTCSYLIDYMNKHADPKFKKLLE